ncbi:MAG: hypothetical protein F6K65_02160 [Moorea sp. SIO3C2]|nr:hypothetical protein [Moorena sp. SIO3C2]
MIDAAKNLPYDLRGNLDNIKGLVNKMPTNLKDIFTQIDRLNKKEQLEVFHYLEQRFKKELDADKIKYNESDYENLLFWSLWNRHLACSGIFWSLWNRHLACSGIFWSLWNRHLACSGIFWSGQDACSGIFWSGQDAHSTPIHSCDSGTPP